MSISIAPAPSAVNSFDICPDSLDDPGVGLAFDAPEHRADRMSLRDALEAEVARYRALDSSFGDLLADHLAELATLANLTAATDPETLRDRADCYRECH